MFFLLVVWKAAARMAVLLTAVLESIDGLARLEATDSLEAKAVCLRRAERAIEAILMRYRSSQLAVR